MRPLFVLLPLLLLGTVRAATPYRVQEGDTLSGLARRAGVSTAQLRAVNSSLRRGSVLRAGQVIQVPNRRLAARKYHVKAGENLSSIASRFGLSAGQLLRANPAYRGGKSIWAGAVLNVPGRLVAARLGPGAAASARVAPVQVASVRPAAVMRPAGLRVTALPQEYGAAGRRWLWPLPGHRYVSSGFGERELDGQDAMHYGLDIVAPSGTPVLAARSGRVLESRADMKRGWGWTVVLEHPDGWITRYAHLSQNLVRAGEAVRQGQRIGRVGDTGHSTGPHLHYGTYLRWNPRDPLSLY